MAKHYGLFLFFIFSSCSGIGLGTVGAGQNDARPTGTVLSQGQFTSPVTGKTVTGSAIIFRSGTDYTLRLEGLTAPSESGLIVQVYASPGGLVAQPSLKSSSGNQNYTLSGISSTVTFNSVLIYSKTNAQAYGSAQLISQF